MDEAPVEELAEAAPGIGEQLRTAREARGLSLEQVATGTRIPQRQLAMLEAGDFAGLPGRTYAIGFARTYARLVGLDGDAAAAGVRAELDAGQAGPRTRPATFEPGDPARVPSKRLGWLSAIAVILVLAGLFAFFRPYFTPAGQLPSLLTPSPAPVKTVVKPAAAPTPAATDPVVFTALADAVWVKFSDGAGKQLMQKELAKGETYQIPADAKDPKLWTGRPEALAITIGGRPVAKLSEAQRTMKNVPVSAAALLARAAPVSPQATPASPPSPTT